MKREGVPAALGAEESPRTEEGARCPRKRLFQEPGQAVNLSTASLHPLGSGFMVGEAGGI